MELPLQRQGRTDGFPAAMAGRPPLGVPIFTRAAIHLIGSVVSLLSRAAIAGYSTRIARGINAGYQG